MITTLLRTKILFVVCLVCHSCISDLEFDYPPSPKQAVLNCVLQTDSIIKVSMYWTGSLNDTVFAPITNANISLFENDVEIGTVPQVDEDGNYLFMHRVKAGVQYRVIASLPDTELSAVVETPKKVYITAESAKKSFFVEYTLKVDALDETISALYIYVFTSEKKTTGNKSYYHESFLYCNSPFADLFNAAIDDMGPEGYFRSYDYFVRVGTEYIRKNETAINIAQYNSRELRVVRVVAANKDYDTYYKSAFVQRSFHPEINLPFTYYPVPIPSNISGGLGQFSAVDIKDFIFEAQPSNNSPTQ